MDDSLSLRAIEDSDQPFLLELFANTRPDLSLVDATTRKVLLLAQYEAQRAHYQRLFPHMEASLILLDGEPAGLLHLACTTCEICVLDINLMPEYRRERVGGRLLNWLREDARELGVQLKLHILQGNAVHSFSERPGFRTGPAQGLHRPMERSPG